MTRFFPALLAVIFLVLLPTAITAKVKPIPPTPVEIVELFYQQCLNASASPDTVLPPLRISARSFKTHIENLLSLYARRLDRSSRFSPDMEALAAYVKLVHLWKDFFDKGLADSIKLTDHDFHFMFGKVLITRNGSLLDIFSVLRWASLDKLHKVNPQVSTSNSQTTEAFFQEILAAYRISLQGIDTYYRTVGIRYNRLGYLYCAIKRLTQVARPDHSTESLPQSSALLLSRLQKTVAGSRAYLRHFLVGGWWLRFARL